MLYGNHATGPRLHLSRTPAERRIYIVRRRIYIIQICTAISNNVREFKFTLPFADVGGEFLGRLAQLVGYERVLKLLFFSPVQSPFVRSRYEIFVSASFISGFTLFVRARRLRIQLFGLCEWAAVKFKLHLDKPKSLR